MLNLKPVRVQIVFLFLTATGVEFYPVCSLPGPGRTACCMHPYRTAGDGFHCQSDGISGLESFTGNGVTLVLDGFSFSLGTSSLV